jgi:4-aminobutyrate aminotransferase-like enzyme
VACAAGLAALEYMQAYDVVGRADRTGAYLQSRLQDLAAGNGSIGLVRGRGMLQAIVFDTNTHEPDPRRRIGLQVALEARRRGLLLRAAPWFVAVAPPLIATREDIDAIVGILRESLAAVIP